MRAAAATGIGAGKSGGAVLRALDALAEAIEVGADDVSVVAGWHGGSELGLEVAPGGVILSRAR